MKKGIFIMILVAIAILSFLLLIKQEETLTGAVVGDSDSNWNGNIKEFKIAAKQWSFEPDSITVEKGDKVMLSLVSRDVPHGFSIPEYGVNKYLEPGKEIGAEFIADKEGTFRFACSVFCGGGHLAMDGKLIVEPAQ